MRCVVGYSIILLQLKTQSLRLTKKLCIGFIQEDLMEFQVQYIYIYIY